MGGPPWPPLFGPTTGLLLLAFCHLLLVGLDTLPREPCLFMIWETPHNFEVSSPVVNVFRGDFVEIENYLELAVAVQTDIIQKVVARLRVPVLLRGIRKTFTRPLSQRLRRAVRLLSHQQQRARHERRLAETLDEQPAQRDAIHAVFCAFD